MLFLGHLKVRFWEAWAVLCGPWRWGWTQVASWELCSKLPFGLAHAGILSDRFPRGSAGKESACNSGDLGSIPGLGRFPGERNGYPLQYSGLENPMDCITHGVAKSWTWLRLSLSLSKSLYCWVFPPRDKLRLCFNSLYPLVKLYFLRNSLVYQAFSNGLISKSF